MELANPERRRRPSGSRTRFTGRNTLAVTDSRLLGKPFDLAPLGPHVALDLHGAERQLAITDTEMFVGAGNVRPSAYRVSRATRRTS